jgi:hypothetical protein
LPLKACARRSSSYRLGLGESTSAELSTVADLAPLVPRGSMRPTVTTLALQFVGEASARFRGLRWLP